MTEMLPRPGGRIAFEDSGGSGPLVVGIPGMGDTRATFRFLVPQLVAAGYRVVTADLRGQGDSDGTFDDYGVESMGEDLVALLEHLGGGPALVIGVSIGCAAAVWAAAEAPDRIAGLVLIRAYAPDVPIPWVQRAAAKVVLAGPWAPAAWAAVFKSFFPTLPPQDLAEYRAALARMLRRPGRAAAMRAMAAADKGPAHVRLPLVTQPTLVVMGGADSGDPVAEGQAVADAVSGRLAVIDGAGHYPHVEFPAETAAALLAFVQEPRGEGNAPLGASSHG